MASNPQTVLEPMVGTWRLTMSTTNADGQTTTSNALRAVKAWFANGRYIQETITGSFAGASHEKLTLLAFNATRGRYEYVTADNHDTVLLFYTSRPDALADDDSINLYANYVSPGDAAPRGVLLTVRTRIAIESEDRHSLTNFYTEPGGEERRFLDYRYQRSAA